MNKFRIDEEEAEIEIARAFDAPMTCMLSRCDTSSPIDFPFSLFVRALIMVLEDRGKIESVANPLVLTSQQASTGMSS
jgi:hypothetical protein